MKNIIRHNFPILIILFLTVFISWPTFLPGYFSHHDDLQVMRIVEMRKCILDLQIPCRWVSDMGYGNGYPLFNYYAPLPYFIGALVSFFTGFLISAKLFFAIPLFLGGVSMYLLANELFGIYPAFFSAILFSFAPFKALDIYVRGDVAESFAISIFPLILYFSLKLIRQKNIKYMIGLSLSLAAFLMSHNIMTVLFAPVVLVFLIYFLTVEKWRNFKFLLISLLLGVGLAAFFIIPAYFEKNLVQIDNLVKLDLNFRAHFATIYQLFFDRTWGYGASMPGPSDTISFQIGWPHWWIVVLSILVFIVNIILRKKFDIKLYLLLLGIFLFSIFMTHIKSVFIWEKIDILKFTQFPWRFLSVSVFSASLLGAIFMQNFEGSFKKYLVLILVVVTIVLNWNYFKPDKFYLNLTDQDKLSGELWDLQQKAAVLDYLPIGAGQPIEPAPDKPIIRSGDADIKSFEKRSNSWSLDLNVKSMAKLEIPVIDFPVWKVYENGKEIKHTNDNYVKRISISVPVGTHLILGKLTNTPIRIISNIISFLSLLAIFYLIIYEKNGKIFK